MPGAALVLALSGCAGVLGIGGPGDGDGPGTRTDFVRLGPLRMDAPAGLAQGVRLDAGGPGGSGDAVYRKLRAAGADELPRARAALHRAAPEGRVRLAFVLPGCAETGARLVVREGSVRAELTGGEDVACGQAVFQLAVFDVARADLPEGTRLPGS